MKLQYSCIPCVPADFCEFCKLVLRDSRWVCSLSGGSGWWSLIGGNGWTRVGGRFVDDCQVGGEELLG